MLIKLTLSFIISFYIIISKDRILSQILTFISIMYIAHNRPTLFMFCGFILIYNIYVSQFQEINNDIYIYKSLILVIIGILLMFFDISGIITISYGLRYLIDWFKIKMEKRKMKEDLLKKNNKSI